MNDLLRRDLTCPITLEVFCDPVSVPCCGKAFERRALTEALLRRQQCPTCNGDLSRLDVRNAAKNVVLSALVASLNAIPPPVIQAPQHQWSCTAVPIKSNNTLCEVTVSLEGGKFQTRPSLFIALLDRSGSMSGRPALQVGQALKYIETLAARNSQVVLVMLTYGSDCTEIKEASEYAIEGGTDFLQAFQYTAQVLKRFTFSELPQDAALPNNVSSVTIAMMTDGQHCGNKSTLASDIQEVLRRAWPNGPLSVHTVGFSNSCDRGLLESIRKSGSVEGLFRYADPLDDDDTLCQKLTAIFEISSRGASVPVSLQFAEQPGLDISFVVNRHGCGVHRQFLDLQTLGQLQVTVTSAVDLGIIIPIQVCSPNATVWQRFLRFQVDQMAEQVLSLNQQNHLAQSIRNLACCLLIQKVKAIASQATEEETQQQLQFIEQQIEQLKAGKAVNLHRLGDLRFSSLFAGPTQAKPREVAPNLVSVQTLPPPPVYLDDKPYNERTLKRYSRHADRANRNELQKQIVTRIPDCISPEFQSVLDQATFADVTHVDDDGNNALMLAAYCGHSQTIKALLAKFPHLDLEVKNPEQETAVTLAVKKRGFHHTLGILLESGAIIPRIKSLERYALAHNFYVTAEILSHAGDGAVSVDETMKPEVVQYIFDRVCKSEKPFDTLHFLQVALAKKMKPLAQQLLDEYKAMPTLSLFLQYGLPPKPDAEDTQFYLDLCHMMLTVAPQLLQEVTPFQESVVLLAAQKGSLPHVKYFLDQGAPLGTQNDKGNTPLYVAAFMGYPCIVEELLNRGALLEQANLKGSTPLFAACTRGSLKVAEMLVQRGANLRHLNDNGDSVILLCCRNKQADMLKFLLNFVDEEFVGHTAQIDGFNAVMACAEQNAPDCLQVLFDYGVNLDQVTALDNPILQGATALHIASYYNRLAVLQKALELGADPNKPDAGGQTPLHLAVIQGNLDIIRALKQHHAQNVTDRYGYTPLMYARDRVEVRKLLVDPLLDALMALCKEDALRGVEAEACRLLQENTGVPGCLEKAQVIDIADYDQGTPLLAATIHGKILLVKTFLELHANPRLSNVHGMTPRLFALWSRNLRLQKVLGVDQKENQDPGDDTALKRLQKMAGKSALDAQILFLSGCPLHYTFANDSGILSRMSAFVNTPMLHTLKLPLQAQMVDYVYNHPKISSANRIFDAKVMTVQKVAQGCFLSAQHLMALNVYSNNRDLHVSVNYGLLNQSVDMDADQKAINVSDVELLQTRGLWKKQLTTPLWEYASTFYQALQVLPLFQGEVYLGSPQIARKLYSVGTEFVWNHFVSASTLWKVAVDNVPSFTSNARKGTVFIIKSLTGRCIADYVQFSYDAEVIFLPGTRFRVNKWYHGDVIALGQENIREHTFGVKEQDKERLPLSELMESDKSLIIELVEDQLLEKKETAV
jgi:ankyrin repeat protein